MGTSKKLLLASLVSAMLVVAFIIGLVPSYDANQTRAAKNQGEISMADVLAAIMGQPAQGGITLQSNVSQLVVKTPSDNFQVPVIPVPVTATVPGATDELVTFVANGAFNAAASSWSGDVFSTPVSYPYAGVLDVGSLASPIISTEVAVDIYGLTNAIEATKAATLVYQAASAFADSVHLSIKTEAGTVDADKNATPDNPFAALHDGEVWISNQHSANSQLRSVVVASLTATTPIQQQLGAIYVSPTSEITVKTPTIEELIAADIVPAGATGIALIEVVDNLASLLDSVDGVNTADALQTWADGVMALAPGDKNAGVAPSPASQFVSVSILYSTDNGATVTAVHDLTKTLGGADVAAPAPTVDLTITGLEATDTVIPQIWSYPTAASNVSDSLILTNVTGAHAWDLVSATAAGGSLEASLSSLSVFGVFNSGISVTGASPSQIPEDKSVPVAITGVFPTHSALDVAAASAAYRVYIGGEVAEFTLSPAKTPAAITAYDGVNKNTAYVNSPILSGAGPVDIQVFDLHAPANFAAGSALIQVVPTHTVTASVNGGVGTVALNPTGGVALPAGTFLEGATVQATATFDPALYTLAGWTVNNVPVAATNPLSITVDADKTVVANLAPAGFVLNLSASPAVGGTATPSAPDLGLKYSNGAVVTLTATPAAGPNWRFTGWTGANAADVVNQAVDPVTGVATAQITMNSDKTIVANFAIAQAFTLTLTALPAAGGTAVAVTPPNAGAQYTLGTVVTVKATASASYKFNGWNGANATELADANAATTTIVMNSNKAVTANFLQQLTLTGVTPDNAWIFGGVVAKVTGTGLTDNSKISIGGTTVSAFRAAANGTSAEFIVPASADASNAATILADVVATEGSDSVTLPNAFTYKRHQLKDGVNTTAFIVADPSAATTVQVTLDGTGADVTPLVLPALTTPAGVNKVFGIARNSQVTETKVNTEVIGSLGTGLINALEQSGEVAAGQGVANAFDFSLHLYADTAVAKNTPAAGSPSFGNANALIDFTRPVDAHGNPVATAAAALLTFPIDATNVTYGDVRKGLMMWGVGTAFDYVTETTTITAPQTVGYESELLVNEVNPAITDATTPPDTAKPNLVAQARIYSLNGFSLRAGSLLPAEVTDGIRLNTTSGTATTTVNGGVTLTIVSPLGGLGWVDRVEFRSVSKALLGTATSTNFVTTPGTNEYQLAFKTPSLSTGAIADLVVFLKSNPNTPAVTLSRAFEYKKVGIDIGPYVLLGAGLLIAILGLLAGGHSGGGGGGPCFIATAAYGTPMAAEIDTLRAVRDTYLLDSSLGTAFVDTYYRISPTIADAVSGSPVLAALIRVLLVPVILVGKLALAMPALTVMGGFSIAALLYLRRRARNQA